MSSAAAEEAPRQFETPSQRVALLTTSGGDADPVLAMSLAPGGALVAAGHESGRIALRHAASGEIIRVLTGHEGAAAAVVFSSDGRVLASTGHDGTVRLWEVRTGEHVRLTGHEGWVQSAAFSPDGTRLATGGYDKTVRLWDVAAGEQRTALEGHTSAIHSVAFSPDGRWLASGSGDRTVRVWDLAGMPQAAVLSEHAAGVRAVGFSPGGEMLISAGEDRRIKFWNVPATQDGDTSAAAGWSNVARATLEGHTGMVWCLAFSPAGRMLASGGFDDRICVWDVAGRRARQTLAGHTEGVSSLAFASDGKSLLSASLDGTIRRWTAEAPPMGPLAALQAHDGSAFSAAFSPDGRILVTTGDDRRIVCRDLSTGRSLRELAGHTEGVFACAFSPDGRVLATGGYDKRVLVWNAATGERLAALNGHEGTVRALDFAPDGQTLVTGGDDKTIRFWGVSDGLLRAALPARSLPVTGLAFSPDGRLLVSTTGDWRDVSRAGEVVLWNVGERTVAAELTGHTTEVLGARFSPDGKRLATFGSDAAVRLWNVETRQAEGVFEHRAGVTAAAFVSDALLATGDQTGLLSVWDLGAKSRIGAYAGHDSRIRCVAVSPDRTVLATTDLEGRVKLWPVPGAASGDETTAAGVARWRGGEE